MASRPTPCDPDRLRRLLDDRLGEDEQAGTADHLEGCAACRLALEGLAAESLWWGEARQLAGEVPATTGPEPCEPPEDWLGALGPPSGPGQIGTLGTYEVVGVIGRGGMGVVLKAFDRPLGRFVAIKMLAPGLATSATARRRFAREARAVAAIAHEHIVPVHAVDATPNGLPFLVMLLVSGRSLQDRLDRTGPLEVREVLRIGMQAASGLAAAHAVGLVHRDVKPANILLENGVERVKLTDFGLARAADDASLTQSGVVAGTPQYMAPEQARGEPVDARADLFSLGSVLYALCTGRPPFRAETTMGVLRRVSDDTPRPIREINPEVPDWLQAIVEKLQAKDPADRFGSAAEVAGLFGRCLAHLEAPGGPPPFPVARPPAPRASRPRALAAAAVLLAIVAGLGASEASGVTRLSELVTTVLRFRTPEGVLVLEVDDPAVKVRVDGADVVINDAGQEVRLNLRAGTHRVETEKGGVVRREVVTITRGGKQTVRATIEPDPPTPLVGRPGATALDPPHATAAVRALADQVKALEAANRRIEQDRLRLMKEGLRRWRAEATPRPFPGRHYEPIPTTVREVPAPPAGRWPGSPGGGTHVRRETSTAAYAVAVSPDGKTLAVGLFDGSIGLYDPASRRLIHTLRGHTTEVRALAFSPDGKTLASGGGTYAEHEQPGELKLWDVAEGRVRRELKGHTAMVWSVAFSPDGATLASGAWDATARLWDAKTGEPGAVLAGHTDAVRSVAFAPARGDEATLATAGFDGTVRFWRVAPGRDGNGKMLRVHEFPEVTGLSGLAFSPDGTTLAVAPRPTSAHADEVILLDVPSGNVRARLKGHPHCVLSLAFSPDGATLASGGGIYADDANRGEVLLWDAASGREVARFDGLHYWVEMLAFTPDGASLAAACGVNEQGGEVHTWPVPGPACPRTQARRLTLPGRRIWSLAVSPDGKSLAVGSGLPEPGAAGFGDDRGGLDLWGPERHHWSTTEPRYVRAVAFSPDGTRLATAEIDGTARLRDAGTGRVVRDFTGHDEGVNGVAFAPDGRTLVTAGLDGTVRVWEAETGREVRRLEGHDGPVYAVAYHPGSRVIASAGDDDTVRLWDAPTGAVRAVLRGHENDVEALAFSPDGKTLASASWDRTARLWDGDTGRPLATLAGHGQAVLGLAFSPDGRTLATSGGVWGFAEPPPAPGELKLWDVRTRSPLCDLGGHADRVFAVAFTPDGRSLVAADWGGAVLLWSLVATPGEAPAPPPAFWSPAPTPTTAPTPLGP